MEDFKVFENDTQSISVGPADGITFENSKESINMYGDIEITQETTVEEIDALINILNKIKAHLNQK